MLFAAHGLAWLLTAAVVMLFAAAGAVWVWSGATVGADATALAHVAVEPFGGRLAGATAVGPDRRLIPLRLQSGRLTPRVQLRPGEQVTVVAVVRRPGWLAWAFGDQHEERLTLRTPVARPTQRWLTVPAGSAARVHFDQPVSAVAARAGGQPHFLALRGQHRSLTLPRRAAAGSIELAIASRPWERLGRPIVVSWFPPAGTAVLVSSPCHPTSMPRLSPRTRGHWRQFDSHTLVFEPSGFGPGLASDLHLRLPQTVAIAHARGNALSTTRMLTWRVQTGSLLRLQQLLAQAGYLPLVWQAAGQSVARTPSAELQAAINPPNGAFSWRYPNIPPELRALWTAGQPNQITRGAVMRFEHDHALAVDGLPGQRVWRALLADAIAARRSTSGYSYVYVHSNIPQSLTLWHDGQTILTSPGNTGVPAAPTQLGTFPVFEHIPVGTMSGTNPDGSHYHDPGIRYISYFNGGDAIHAFNRSSFGTPQSLGCVELPLAAATKVWPYTPIGTLVTIEN